MDIALGEHRTNAPATPPLLTQKSNAYLKTLRVRGLSATHNWRTAKKLLRSILALDDSSRLEICSLALSPHQLGEKVATINFEGTSALPSDRNEWVIDTPCTESSDDDDRRPQEHQQHIIIDSHFEGFTPMNSFEKDEDHKIE